MILRRPLLLAFIFFTGSHAMENPLADLTASLRMVKPSFVAISAQQGKESWEPYYQALNEGYDEILQYRDTHRAWVQETLPVLAAGHMHDKDGIVIKKLSYPPAHYALGIMALEDGEPEKAWGHLKKAVRISQYRPQERSLHNYAKFAGSRVQIELKKYTEASVILTHLFASLQPDELPFWKPKIQAELAKIIDKIEAPWRKIPALLLHEKEEKRNYGIRMVQELFVNMDHEAITANKQDIHATLLLIRSLAEKELSPQAQVIIAALHLKQHLKPKCIFTQLPIEPQSELALALLFARSADKADCKPAKKLRGEIAHEYARYLEKNGLSQDPSIQVYVWELYRESSSCEFKPGISRHAHACLEDKTVPLDDEQEKKHLQQLISTSRDGNMGFQDLLTKIFFLGHTFGCGYTVSANMFDAYEHANNNPSSLEMQLIQGVILMNGIEKPTSKKAKKSWAVKPDIEAGERLLESALGMNEELAYVRLDEFFKSKNTPEPIKKIIFEFIEKKAKERNPSLCAIRGFGALLIHAGDTQGGIKILESIGTQYKNPQGYCELCDAYLFGDGVPLDFMKATNYCIKALRFFNQETIKSKGAAIIRDRIGNLISKLNAPENKENKQMQVCLDLVTRAITQYGISWEPNKTKE